MFNLKKIFSKDKASPEDTPKELDRETLIKAVHMNIGFTLIQCQVLEGHLVKLVDKVYPNLIKNEDTGLYYNQFSGLTLGKLIGKLNEHYKLPKDFNKEMNDVLSLRNMFVHRLMYQEYYSVWNKEKLAQTYVEITKIRRKVKALSDKFYIIFFDIAFDKIESMPKTEIEKHFDLNK